jgi:hypothetical protein
MRTFLLIVASVVALANFSAAALAADQKQTQPPEQWRYTFRNGLWWYWLPEARWVYWQNEHWNDYSPPASCDPAGAACHLCGFSKSPGPSPIEWTQREVAARSAYSEYAGPWRAQFDDIPYFSVGPFYGHSESVVGYPMLSVNSEPGPYYGKADAEIRYPTVSVNSEVGPFYGKADSSVQGTINMRHFPDY